MKKNSPGKNVLVTGAAGFIGFHTAKALLDRGDRVTGTDNLNGYYDVKLKKARLNILKEYSRFEFNKADLSQEGEAERIIKKGNFTEICHLAAQPGVRYSIENPLRYEYWNNAASLQVLEAAKKHGPKNLVMASSSSVYGNSASEMLSEKENVDRPISVYAATKKANELYAHVYHALFGMNITLLRFFTVYGPWGRPDMAMFKFAKNILAGKPIDVYNRGRMKRDFTYVDDIVRGIVKALDLHLGYEIINLGNHRPVELLRLISVMEDALGKKAVRKMMPAQPGDVLKTYADITRAKKLLGFYPETTIEEGVRKFVSWYRGYYGV